MLTISVGLTNLFAIILKCVSGKGKKSYSFLRIFAMMMVIVRSGYNGLKKDLNCTHIST